MSSYKCRDSHYKDKTVWRLWPLFHFYNGNPFTRKDGLYIETGPWFWLVVVTWPGPGYDRQRVVSVIDKTAYHKISQKVSNRRDLYLEISDCCEWRRRLGTTTVEMPVNFQSDLSNFQATILSHNLAACFVTVQDLMTKRLMRYWSVPCSFIYKQKLAKPALGSRHG